MELFNYDYGKDNSPEDKTVIKQMALYYNQDDFVLFKKLCKIGIKRMYGNDAFDRGNVSDLLLLILKQLYGEITLEEPLSVASESGEPEDEIFDGE
jgi:hypothetical protein